MHLLFAFVSFCLSSPLVLYPYPELLFDALIVTAMLKWLEGIQMWRVIVMLLHNTRKHGLKSKMTWNSHVTLWGKFFMWIWIFYSLYMNQVWIPQDFPASCTRGTESLPWGEVTGDGHWPPTPALRLWRARAIPLCPFCAYVACYAVTGFFFLSFDISLLHLPISVNAGKWFTYMCPKICTSFLSNREKEPLIMTCTMWSSSCSRMFSFFSQNAEKWILNLGLCCVYWTWVRKFFETHPSGNEGTDMVIITIAMFFLKWQCEKGWEFHLITD